MGPEATWGDIAQDAAWLGDEHDLPTDSALGQGSVLRPELPTRANWGRPGAWAGLAACRDRPDVNFFPDLDRKLARREVANAKAVCAGCPVRQACAEAGLYERFGIWGGLDGDERRALRRGQHKEPAVVGPDQRGDLRLPAGLAELVAVGRPAAVRVMVLGK